MRALLEAAWAFERAAVVAARDRALKSTQRKMERFMAGIFRKQGRLFVAALAGYRSRFVEALGSDDLSKIMAEVELETSSEMELGMRALITDGFGSGGATLTARLGTDLAFDVAHPRATAWLEKHAAELVTEINETTRSEIGTLVKQQVGEGWSYDRTAREIKRRFSEFAVGKPQQHIDSRAHLVAVTESSKAYEHGSMEMARQMKGAGLSLEHAWQTVGDDRVSEGCEQNEADGWIDLEQAFSSGDTEPPRFPGCRCTSLYRVAGGEGD